MSESALMREIMVDASKVGVRLFRNNVAKGWIGAAIGPTARDCTVFVRAGSVIIADARRLNSGLIVGSGDLIGFHVERDGKFVSVETKSKSGRLTTEQKNWMEQVRNAGGIGIVARSVEEALEGLKNG